MLSLNNVDRSRPKGRCILPFILALMHFLKTAAIYCKQSEAIRFLHDGTAQRRAGEPRRTITDALSLFISGKSKMGNGDPFPYERGVNVVLITNNANNNCKLGHGRERISIHQDAIADNGR